MEFNFDEDLKNQLEKEEERSRKYQEAHWTVFGLTAAGLACMAIGAHIPWTALIQFGIFAQAVGLLAGLWITRKGNEW